MKEIEFIDITKADRDLLEPIEKNNVFGDTTFSLIYAWRSYYRYQYFDFGEIIVIKGHGINEKEGYILKKKHPGARLDSAIERLLEYCEVQGHTLTIEYVSEEVLEEYQACVKALGLQAEIRSIRDYSDYIYRTDAFISLQGKQNKSKRGDVNWLLRNHPSLQYVRYTPELREDCLNIFEHWCQGRNCSECYYGCEKKAFMELLDLYHPDRYRIGLSYCDGIPLSFAVAEQTGKDTMSYYFQKNRERIRGLMFWLNQQMALEHPDVEYINLGEDMGLPGIQMDKESLHPCKMLHKYIVTIQR